MDLTFILKVSVSDATVSIPDIAEDITADLEDLGHDVVSCVPTTVPGSVSAPPQLPDLNNPPPTQPLF